MAIRCRFAGFVIFNASRVKSRPENCFELALGKRFRRMNSSPSCVQDKAFRHDCTLARFVVLQPFFRAIAVVQSSDGPSESA